MQKEILNMIAKIAYFERPAYSDIQTDMGGNFI